MLHLTRHTGFNSGDAVLPETVALLARMSSQPDGTRRLLIDDAIRSMVDRGLWPKLDGFYWFAAHDAQASLLNWKSSTFNCTVSGAVAFTADRGRLPDGSAGSCLSTGYTPSTSGGQWTQDSVFVGAYSRTNNAAVDQSLFAAILNPATQIVPVDGSNRMVWNANTNAAGVLSPQVDGQLGWRAVTRRAGSVGIQYAYSGTTEYSSADASTGLSPAPLTFGGHASTSNGNQLICGMFGAGLTAAENASLLDIVNTLKVGVGA